MSITLRFEDIIEAKNRTIMLVGAGATGSWFAAMAVKQDYTIIAVDFDKLELHNIGTSIYTDRRDICEYKVDVLAKMLGNRIKPIRERFSEELLRELSIFTNIDLIVSAVDNMEARRQIAEAAKNHMKPLVDMRVHYPYAMVYAVEGKPSAIRKFMETLYDDEQAWQGSCTAQNTPFLSALAASIALKYASFPIRGFAVATADVEKMTLTEAREE